MRKANISKGLFLLMLVSVGAVAQMRPQSEAPRPAQAPPQSPQTPAVKPGAVAPEELLKTVAALDKALFDAVNTCDIQKVRAFWSDDAEFYHDKSGLMVGGQQITDSIKNNLCGKVTRELVVGTLEVYPLQGYGVVEMGVHRFHHPWQQDHGEVGEAKFIHVWRNEKGAWKITRVISYDHAPAK